MSFRIPRRLLLPACLLAVLLIPAAQATTGDLDPTFGTAGKVTTLVGPVESEAYALVVQPDGKLVAAGYGDSGSNDDFALARYNADGSLDTGFGTGGKVLTAIGSSTDSANALVQQPDGKLVAAGYSYDPATGYDFAIARYNADGSLDTSFGSGGRLTTAIGSGTDVAYALILQPDGKLVAAGRTDNGPDDDFALVRYNANGSLDTSFGTAGKVTTFIGSGDDLAFALALQPDGKLVAGGYNQQSPQAFTAVALARFNPNGSLDASFGAGGKVATVIGSYGIAGAIALQPDGKVVVAGQGDTGSQRGFALLRYNADGSLDAGFGTGGKVMTAIGSTDSAEDVTLQPDGKLLVAGYARNGSTNAFAAARYSTNGSLDASFGSGGKITAAIGVSDATYAIALQPDGKLVAAGGTWDGSTSRFALVRYLGSMLTVAKGGNGTGTVTSNAGGINCGPTCSAPLAAVPVQLTATADPGSAFTGWSGDCSGTGACAVTMDTSRSVTATFAALCVVPKLKGKKLAAAKRALKRSHCSVGKVKKVFSARVKKGRVIAPKPKAGKQLAPGAKVRLEVSKGKKR